MDEGSSNGKRQIVYTCSSAAIKQFVQAKQEAECASGVCKQQLNGYKAALHQISRAFTDVYHLMTPQDRAVAHLSTVMQRVANEFGVPLDIPEKSPDSEKARTRVHALATTIERNYATRGRSVGKRSADDVRSPKKSTAKPAPAQPSERDSSRIAVKAPPVDDDVVVLSDDDDVPPANVHPPPVPPNLPQFLSRMTMQGTSSTSTSHGAAGMNAPPPESNWGGSSPPSLASELETASNPGRDQSDVEMAPVDARRVSTSRRRGHITRMHHGVNGGLSMYVLDDFTHRFYANTETLAKISTRLNMHPIDLPSPGNVCRGPPMLQSLRVETAYPSASECRVQVIFDYEKMFDNQLILLYYYVKSVAESDEEDARWESHSEPLPCKNNRTIVTLQFGEVEEDEVVMFSCRMGVSGRMGPFTVPLAVSLARPVNGRNTSVVYVNSPQAMNVPTQEVVDVE